MYKYCLYVELKKLNAGKNKFPKTNLRRSKIEESLFLQILCLELLNPIGSIDILPQSNQSN